jgi:hypothetical protein
LTDDLVDLLTETIHQIGARAERRVDRELLDDLKRVSGKQNLLFGLAGAARLGAKTSDRSCAVFRCSGRSAGTSFVVWASAMASRGRRGG